VRRRWDAAAQGWERERERLSAFGAPVTAAMIAALDPKPEDEVLELASGTGDVTAALAGRVARLLATDIAPSMVDAARRLELTGVEHEVQDMQALDLPDASFDAVVCRYGYMLVPDRRRAFAETRRVLRPGGRLVFATWAAAKRNPWATVFGPVLVERGLMEAPKPDEAGQFSLGDAATLEEFVRTAGFEHVEVEEVPVEIRVASWDEYAALQTSVSTLLRETLAQLDKAARAEIDEAARPRFERFRSDGGYALPGVALVTSAS
jgi:ubiquinone/menaquinone biosynthesis C-methylase UbiE